MSNIHTAGYKVDNSLFSSKDHNESLISAHVKLVHTEGLMDASYSGIGKSNFSNYCKIIYY